MKKLIRFIKKLCANDYFINVCNKIVTVLLGLLSTSFLTRYLGVGLKGEYSYITQVVSIAALVMDLGVNQSYSYFYKKNGGGVYGKYVSFYALQTLIYLIAAAILSITLHHIENVVFIFMLVPFTVAHRQMEATMAVENIRLKIKMHMFNSATKCLGCGTIFFLNKADVIGNNVLFPVLLLILIDTVTVLVYYFNHKEKITLFKNDWKFFGEILKFSWMPMLTALLVTLNYSVDVIFLKHIGTKTDTSLYSTAAGIINYVWLIPDAFKEVLISRVAKSDDVSHVNRALKFSVAVILVLIAGFAIAGRPAIWLLYGSDFADSYAVTLILMIGCISMVFYKILGVLMLAEGRRVFYFLTLLASVIINVVINALVIPAYGMYGAAWASVASYTVCGLSFYIYFLIIKKQTVLDTLIIRKSDVKALIKRFKK